MKRSLSMLLLLVASAALVVSGCKKEKKPGAGTAAGTAAAAAGSAAAGSGATTEKAAAGSAKKDPAAGTAAAAAGTAEGSAAAAAGSAAGSGAATASAADAEKNCGALHDFFKKMMAALSKKFGKASKSKKLPPRDKFIEACKVLPADVVNCMNPQVAMKEQEKCKKAKEKVDPKAIAKFKAIMSGK